MTDNRTPANDTIRLFIRDCRVDLQMGMYEREIGHAQPVIVNVECEARLTRRYDNLKNDDLSEVIDYAPLYHFIHDELPAMGHIYMLESAAEHIITFSFKDPRVEKTSVRIEKTSLLADTASTGIEITRTRP